METISAVLVPILLLLTIITAGIMAVKAIKKQDVSLWGGVIARIYLVVVLGTFLFNPIITTTKVIEIHIAVGLMLISDVIIGALYFIFKRHISIIEYKNLILTLNNLTDKYATLVENAPVGIFATSMTGLFEYANKKLLEMLGYEKEEILGKSIYDLISERDVPTAKYYAREKAEGRIRTAKFTLHLVKKNGEILAVEITGSKTENGHPTITGMIIPK